MSVEGGDASTYATTASCQASPFVTFFGIQEDGLDTFCHDGNNTTANSTALDPSRSSFRDISLVEPSSAAMEELGALLRWERPGAACAALGACAALFLATNVLGHNLLGVALDLLLAVSAAVALFQLFPSPSRVAFCHRLFAALRTWIPTLFA